MEHARGGHVFSAENINGKVHFIDPQSGESDASRYFDQAIYTEWLRIDDASPTSAVDQFLAK
jgi:hypothetical protein